MVRLYQEFLDGKTTDYIKRIFEKEGVRNWDGGTKWQATTLKKGFDEIENKLKSIKGAFQPIRIQRIGERETLMIISEHIVPETGNRMKVFHLIFQLNDKERKEAAASARKKEKI